VENLGKEYIIGGAEQRHDSFREMLTGSLAAPFRRLRKLGGTASEDERFWALRDVSFNVEQGEVLGIIGRNGAGKSTLLKVLSRITSPTEGRVVTRGRMASLLEVGTGFHPELTGRENIYLNGAVLGMSRAEVVQVFDEIVEFSGVGKFLDTPVKRYSSGMYVRLAFSVAAHLETDILLVDEVLAVGDSEFQKKCMGKMGIAAKTGRTILFVSHNLAAISALCSRCVRIDGGRIVHKGPTQQVVNEYLRAGFTQEKGAVAFDFKDLAKRGGSGAIRIDRISFIQNPSQEPTRHLLNGIPLDIIFDYSCHSLNPLKNVSFAIALRDSSGRYACRLDSELTCESVIEIELAGRMVCRIDALPLGPGRYTFEAGIAANGLTCDHVEDIAFIDIDNGDFFLTGRTPPDRQSAFLVRHAWVSQ
jgi:lipopolysaccharide transport system ATP-binding protein